MVLKVGVSFRWRLVSFCHSSEVIVGTAALFSASVLGGDQIVRRDLSGSMTREAVCGPAIVECLVRAGKRSVLFKRFGTVEVSIKLRTLLLM